VDYLVVYQCEMLRRRVNAASSGPIDLVPSPKGLKSVTAALAKAATVKLGPAPRLAITRTLKSGRKYHGFLDLFVEFADGSTIALEIDRANKRWSLAKLQYASQELDSCSLWARWRGVVALPPGSGVEILDLSSYANLVPPKALAVPRQESFGHI